MQKRPALKFQLWCPLSGAEIEADVVAPHKVPVMVCENGTLFAYCRLHNLRTFIRDMMLIDRILSAENRGQKITG